MQLWFYLDVLSKRHTSIALNDNDIRQLLSVRYHLSAFPIYVHHQGKCLVSISKLMCRLIFVVIICPSGRFLSFLVLFKQYSVEILVICLQPVKGITLNHLISCPSLVEMILTHMLQRTYSYTCLSLLLVRKRSKIMCRTDDSRSINKLRSVQVMCLRLGITDIRTQTREL